MAALKHESSVKARRALGFTRTLVEHCKSRCVASQEHAAPVRQDAMLACLRKASVLQWQAVDTTTGAVAEVRRQM